MEKLLLKSSCLWLLLFLFNPALSQKKEGYNWILGTKGSRVSFNTIGNNPITFRNIIYPIIFTEGHSSISDSNGNFLFSCDGFRIWDTMGNIMQNGDSLVPNKLYNKDVSSYYTQGSLILPFENDIYKVFTPTVSDSTFDMYWVSPQPNFSVGSPFDMLLIHTVDMKANNGVGKVIEKKKEILNNTLLSKSQMQACRHSNGKDWWLLKQGNDTNIIYTFLIKQDTVLGPYIQNFAPYRFGITDVYGQACFNKEGTKYAVVQCDSRPTLGYGGIHFNGQLMIADFNRCNGEISNPKYYNVPNLSAYSNYIDSLQGGGTGLGDLGANGVAFSYNGQFVYVAKFFNIMQLDLTEPDSALAWYHVAGMDTSVTVFQRYQNLYFGADHKLYIGNINGQLSEMSVIDSPNNKGSACNFCPKCLRFDTTGIGSPPNMPDYTLGADLSMVCYPLQSQEPLAISEKLEVYPNPSSTIFYIKNKKGKKKELYNSVGELILSTTKEEINVSRLSSGFYYLKVDNQTTKVIVE